MDSFEKKQASIYARAAKIAKPGKTNPVRFTGRDYLQRGIRCLQNGAYFEAHEFWEVPWRKMGPPYRAFWQALIQFSVGAYHLQNNNLNGCRSLWCKALRHCRALQNTPGEIPLYHLHQLQQCVEKSLSGLPDVREAFRQVRRFSGLALDFSWAELCLSDLLDQKLPQ